MPKYMNKMPGLSCLVRQPQNAYAAASVVVLFVSTIVWSLAVARVQLGNSDQLVDGYLFENAHTFMHAQFPQAHTMLLKWPLFWLLGALQNTPSAYLVLTVFITLLTVGALAYIVYRINTRPLVFGTLCLALACVLMLVPAQVFHGVTAPLSIAMITGRNIEYVLYIGCLVLLIRAKKTLSWQWGVSAALMGLLLASDHLFLAFSVLSPAALFLVVLGCKQEQLRVVALRWLGASGVGWMISVVVLMTMRQFTYIVGGVSPYSHAGGLTNIRPAAADGLIGILVNMGMTTGGGRLTAPAAVINAALLVLIAYAGYRAVKNMATLKTAPSAADMLSIMLLVTAVTAVLMYVFARHPYISDARYLTILVFAGFVVLATYSRTVSYRAGHYYAVGGLLFIAVLLGLFGVWRHTDKEVATGQLGIRNTRIVAALRAQPVQILAGDYWRVFPIKLQTKGAKQQVLPLRTCVQPKQILTSTAWNQSLLTHSFAYLVPVQPSGTPFGTCNLQTVEHLYGTPSFVTVIAGTQYTPAELLLFYSKGAGANISQY
jgi:hypothetical protein